MEFHKQHRKILTVKVVNRTHGLNHASLQIVALKNNTNISLLMKIFLTSTIKEATGINIHLVKDNQLLHFIRICF